MRKTAGWDYCMFLSVSARTDRAAALAESSAATTLSLLGELVALELDPRIRPAAPPPTRRG
jgi:hypothetical protein